MGVLTYGTAVGLKMEQAIHAVNETQNVAQQTLDVLPAAHIRFIAGGRSDPHGLGIKEHLNILAEKMLTKRFAYHILPKLLRLTTQPLKSLQKFLPIKPTPHTNNLRATLLNSLDTLEPTRL